MSQDNVVPFEGRRAIDRRGSPDKAFSSDPIEIHCPDCGASLSLEEAAKSGREVLCEECGTPLDLAASRAR